MNDKHLLKVDQLTKVFYQGGGLSRIRIVAVNNASVELHADKPEIFTLAGESGSGKSTLAKLILGLIEPTEGTITYRGMNVTTIRRRQDRLEFMREVQPVFQNPFETFNPLKTVDTYLFETEANYRVGRHDDSSQAIEDALQLVGLSLAEIQGRYPSELSGGQLQRLSVARSLITRPRMIVADEPVSMIDASLRMSIVNLFRTLREEKNVSVIYITHDLATAYYVSDRIAIMLRGSIVEMGSVEKVLGDPLHPYTRILEESVPFPDPERVWDQDIALTDLEAREFSRVGCKFAGRCPSVKDICRNVEPSLEEVRGRMVKCHLYPSSKGESR